MRVRLTGVENGEGRGAQRRAKGRAAREPGARTRGLPRAEEGRDGVGEKRAGPSQRTPARWESVQLAQAARRVVLSIGAATLRSCSVLRGGRPVPAALTVLGPSKQRDAT